MRKVNEIFYSIQGEGYYSGTPAIFLRFSGCNITCPFCDTAHHTYILMSEEEIVEKIRQYPASHVVITGGEPGLQITSTLIDKLHEAGKFVQIETNGTLALPTNIDWVTCSPKKGGEVKLTHIDELKVVYTGQDIAQYDNFAAQIYCLQPCSGKNTEKVIELVKQYPRWRLSLQTHIMLNIQ